MLKLWSLQGAGAQVLSIFYPLFSASNKPTSTIFLDKDRVIIWMEWDSFLCPSFFYWWESIYLGVILNDWIKFIELVRVDVSWCYIEWLDQIHSSCMFLFFRHPFLVLNPFCRLFQVTGWFNITFAITSYIFFSE